MNRRFFIQSAIAFSGSLCVRNAQADRPQTHISGTRRFTIDLCPGMVGIDGSIEEQIKLAASHNFESIQPPTDLPEQSEQRQRLNELLQHSGLSWGAAGLPVEFRKDSSTFHSGLEKLPKIAAGLHDIGVTRMGTWLSPASDDLTYTANFRQHVDRLGKISAVLADHDIRFGLEYVGPKTLWSSKRFAFIHTLDETLELIAETNKKNIGIVLDSWHWYTSGETLEDLKKLKNDQVVAVDLNDAPKDVEREQQIDSRRELPNATGVIDVKTFLQFLVEVGYDGPVRAEPFNKKLNELDNDAAARATSEALHAAVALI